MCEEGGTQGTPVKTDQYDPLLWSYKIYTLVRCFVARQNYSFKEGFLTKIKEGFLTKSLVLKEHNSVFPKTPGVILHVSLINFG